MVSLILASRSPRRATLLAKLGMPFEIVPVDIDEALEPGPSGEAIATLARRKAHACRALRAEGIILAADTLVEAHGALLGKPASLDEARAALRMMSGSRHRVLTGVCLLDAAGREAAFVEETSIWFDDLTESDIDWIVTHDEPLDKAGGCDIDRCAGCFIKWIDGSYDNVMGLPVSRVRGVLRSQFGCMRESD